MKAMRQRKHGNAYMARFNGSGVSMASAASGAQYQHGIGIESQWHQRIFGIAQQALSMA
jgi:hypothetical protein